MTLKVMEIKLRGFVASGFWGVGLFFAFLEGVFTNLGNRASGLYFKL